jgi:hypothetical protein
MSDLRIVPRAFLGEFIQLFCKKPCLWKIKSKEYSDKNKKENVAYEQLRVKLSEIDPEATKEAVANK